jgi:uncharacterized RDD family membrane protein YckC
VSIQAPILDTTTSERTQEMVPAGLLARCCAGILDLGLIALVVRAVAEILAGTGRYLPIEITVIATYALYAALATTLFGKTLGGWICGVRVTNLQNQRLSAIGAVIRAIAVAIAQLMLFIPFLILLTKRNRRGWHDRLAGSQVTINPASRRHRSIRTCILLILCACISVWIIQTLAQYHSLGQWNRDADTAGLSLLGDTDQAISIQSLTPQQRDDITQWLGANTLDPSEYLINTAAKYQVTLVGERHGIRQNLEFFNRMIPDLYHRAQIRVIALECLSDVQDRDVQRLITASEFDRELFMNIAREHPWPTWGYQNHWRVLETVWQLNQTLPADDCMRVVGIMPPIDLVSLHMVKYGPWWEKLRLVRVLPDLPKMFMHDAHYARCVERAAFGASSARALVWVGNYHTRLTFTGRTRRDGGVFSHSYRMGGMLAGRYPGQVAQIALHSNLDQPAIAAFIESGLAQTGKSQVGFDVAGSPLAPLFDETAPIQLRLENYRPCWGDLASGYIVLAPADQLEPDTWWQGFINPRMFGRYRPFLEMVTQRTLADHRDAEKHIHLAFNNY